MENSGRYLCLDIGGTTVKSGILAGDGAILADREDPTPTTTAVLLDFAASLIEKFIPADALNGLCVSTTGIVDPWSGRIAPEDDTVIEDYRGTFLREALQKRTGLPVETENDVNCALLGEHWLGAAKGFQNAVCVTIGTGIGGAFLVGGQLYRGTRFNAMEVGHIPFFPSNWEQRASTRALVHGYARLAGLPPKALLDLNGRVVLERAREGDKAALRSVDEMCFYLAQGITALMVALAPDVFVVGGGIAESMAFLFPRLDKVLSETLPTRFREGVAICAAELGNRAGLVGALRHFLNMQKERKK